MYMNLPMGSLTCVIAKKIKASSTYDFKLYVVLSKNFAIRHTYLPGFPLASVATAI